MMAFRGDVKKSGGSSGLEEQTAAGVAEGACRVRHTKANNTTRRFGKTAASIGAADRAAAMVYLALGANGEGPLAKAALYGDTAGTACQYKRLKHVDGLQ